MGYEYKIEYKKGSDNKVADALSRVHQEEGECQALTLIQPIWISKLQQTYERDNVAQDAIAECVSHPYNLSYFSYAKGLLRHKGRLYVGTHTDFRSKVVAEMHSAIDGGHSGEEVTLQKIRSIFWWPGLKRAVQEHIKQCHVCQISKHENRKNPGLLQPLPIPDQA